MLRSIMIMLAAASLILLTFGCEKKPQRTDDDTPAETGANDDAPGDDKPGDDKPGDDKPGDDKLGDDKPDADFPVADQDLGEQEPDAGQPQACPEPRQAQGMCAQVITWALNPDTGTCCQYATPCETPENWETFSSEAECKQAAPDATKTQ